VGYFRGLIHGIALGTLAGLALAPQPGDRTRAQMREAAKGVKGGIETTGRAVQRVAPAVGPVAGSAVQIVTTRVRRRRPEDEGVSSYTGNGATAGTDTTA